MKVCVLFYNLGGYHLARLAAAQAECTKRGWEFSAIEIVGGSAEHPWGDIAKPDYVRTLRPSSNEAEPTVGDPDAFQKMLDDLNPDWLALPGWGFDFSRIAMRWAKRNQSRLILMSESKKDDASRNVVKEALKKWLYVRNFDCALVGGQKHFDYLVELGMPPKKIAFGYDVVDNQFFEQGVEVERQNWQSTGRPACLPEGQYFLSANRFIPRKNLVALVKAFAKARTELNSDWTLVLLGGGDSTAESELKALIASLELTDKVHLPGFVKYDDINRWYAGASVFIHPALAEQWGLVVNEAMAAGLPILLSNTCGCHPELIEDGITGYSFDPQGIAQMAEAMVKISQSDMQQMGIASQRKINAEFPAERFGSGLMEAIDSVT